MTSDEAAVFVIDALSALGIPFMVVGSLSSNYYGVPRATKDADIVIELGSHSVAAIAKLLGPEFRLDPQAMSETVTATLKNEIHVVGSKVTIELFRLSSDDHDQSRFSRRRTVPNLGRLIPLPTAEDVIITKLRWSQGAKRTKDVDDVRNVLAVQGDNLDWNYIHHWTAIHGTRELLDRIRASIPPI